jgi:hypothetical protein
MTEDDTIKRLRGLTYHECLEMYTTYYLKFHNQNPGSNVVDGWDSVDKILAPYGWTCQKMADYGIRNELT